jgi:hypothetical protein
LFAISVFGFTCFIWSKNEFLALKAGGMLMVPEDRSVRKICGRKNKEKYTMWSFMIFADY